VHLFCFREVLALPDGLQPYATVRTNDGVLETLHALRQQYRMAIMSASKHTEMALIHRASGILSWFEFVLTIEAYARPKPAPDPYLTALHLFGAVARDGEGRGTV